MWTLLATKYRNLFAMQTRRDHCQGQCKVYLCMKTTQKEFNSIHFLYFGIFIVSFIFLVAGSWGKNKHCIWCWINIVVKQTERNRVWTSLDKWLWKHLHCFRSNLNSLSTAFGISIFLIKRMHWCVLCAFAVAAYIRIKFKIHLFSENDSIGIFCVSILNLNATSFFRLLLIIFFLSVLFFFDSNWKIRTIG